MRPHFLIAAHRGGDLCIEDHRMLMRWARLCVEHVIPRVSGPLDKRVLDAIRVAKEWEIGGCATGVAMKASVAAHAAARESDSEISKAVARASAHAVATAHMADHALGGALYAQVAHQKMQQSALTEQEWQIEELRMLLPSLADLVCKELARKRIHFVALRE